MADDPREAEWTAFRAEIGRYLRTMFSLSNQREQDTWLYIVGLAAELEFLALALLWLADGSPGLFEDYKGKLTLGLAADAIERRQLLNEASIETLKAVAQLRNSVSHRVAVYGVAVARPERALGMYKGRHVFTDLDALKGLGDDVHTAALAMLRRQNELERAPEAR